MEFDPTSAKTTPEALVISANLGRRHLSVGQMSAIVVELSEQIEREGVGNGFPGKTFWFPEEPPGRITQLLNKLRITQLTMNKLLSLPLAALLGALAFTNAHAQNFSSEELQLRTVERRAVDAAIWGMPIVSLDAMRQAYFRDGNAKYGDIIWWPKGLSAVR
jgi:hypothetical protein